MKTKYKTFLDKEAQKDFDWLIAMQELDEKIREDASHFRCWDSCSRCGSVEVTKRHLEKGFWQCCPNTIVGAPALIRKV